MSPRQKDEQMASGGITHAVLRWAVRRDLGEGAEGSLLWVDGDGQVHHLGVYTIKGMREWHWGVSVAYTLTTRRDLRSRLAACRETSSRLARALDLLARPRPRP